MTMQKPKIVADSGASLNLKLIIVERDGFLASRPHFGENSKKGLTFEWTVDIMVYVYLSSDAYFGIGQK